MYAASVPTFAHALKNLSAILDKGEKYAEEKKFDSEILVSSRLAPDMFALARQVQIATDVIKGGVARLAGVEIPSFPDTETTFEALQARITKLQTFLDGIKPAQIDGTENKIITLSVGGNELKFEGQAYLLSFVIPNVYFHITTTYAILRHNGVPVGKMDFLGAIQ